jgi:hypothetical protein
MKSALVLDQFADVSTMPEEYREKAEIVFVNGKQDWIYPKGTEFEGEHALDLVMRGQAAPIDEECAKACGMSPAELRRCQRQYLAASAGIKGKNDLALFMGEVIDGYLPGTTDAKPIYKPGKYWDKYQKATAEKAKTEGDE